MHQARALKARGEFIEALDVLDAAQEACPGQGRTIIAYKEDVIKAMNEHMLSFDKANAFAKQNQMMFDDSELKDSDEEDGDRSMEKLIEEVHR